MTNKEAQRQEPTIDQDTDQFDPYRYGKISFTTKFFRRLISTKLPEPNEEDMLDSIPPGAGPDADQVRRAGAEYVASHARGHATSSATDVRPDVAGNNTDATGVPAGSIAGATAGVTGATADATGALLGPTGSRVGATGGSVDASLTGIEGASGSADAAGGSAHASDGSAHASDGGADARTVIIAELDPTKKKQFVLSPEEVQALRGGQRRRGVLWFVAVCALLGGLVMLLVVGNRPASSGAETAASAATDAERDGQAPRDAISPGEPAVGASAPPASASASAPPASGAKSRGVHSASASGDDTLGVHAANATGNDTSGVHPANPPEASAARADGTLSGGTLPDDTHPARATSSATSSTGTSPSHTKPSGAGSTRTNSAGTRRTRVNPSGTSPRASAATSSVGSETSSTSTSSDFFDPRK